MFSSTLSLVSNTNSFIRTIFLTLYIAPHQLPYEKKKKKSEIDRATWSFFLNCWNLLSSTIIPQITEECWNAKDFFDFYLNCKCFYQIFNIILRRFFSLSLSSWFTRPLTSVIYGAGVYLCISVYYWCSTFLHGKFSSLS